MRHIILLVSGAAWVFMIHWLINKEILPYYEYSATATYKNLLKDVRKKETVRKDIYLGKGKIGSSITIFEPVGKEGYTIKSSMEIIKRNEVAINTRFDTKISSAFTLDSFRWTANGKIFSLNIDFELNAKGTRKGNKLDVEIIMVKPERFVTATSLDIPEELVLADPISHFVPIGKPSVGKIGYTYELELELLKVKPVRARAEVTEMEEIEINGKRFNAYKVEIRRPNADLATKIIWVDEKGEVLKEKIPLLSIYDITSIVTQRN